MGQPCRLLLVGSMDNGSSLMDQVGPSFPINRDDGAICECHSQLLEAEVNSRRLQRAPLRMGLATMISLVQPVMLNVQGMGMSILCPM